MLRNFNQSKFKFHYSGQKGLPEHYPTPKTEGLMFYIQRNHNQNTITYAINLNPDGLINEQNPFSVQWIKYNEGGKIQDLNLIEDKLAYGYKSWMINNNTFKFQIAAYDLQDFYLTKSKDNIFTVVTKLNDEMMKLSNIYAYAEEFGAFPQIKYIEFFGSSIKDTFPSYHKILL